MKRAEDAVRWIRVINDVKSQLSKDFSSDSHDAPARPRSVSDQIAGTHSLRVVEGERSFTLERTEVE
jgi:hypothetical protein